MNQLLKWLSLLLAGVMLTSVLLACTEDEEDANFAKYADLCPSELYEGVWGEMPLPSSNNTITVHILNLRRKLEDTPSAPKLIRTVWGRGYQID